MEWRRGQTIGRGSSATVSMATCCGCNHIFAVKSVELSQSELLQREQSFLCNLSSPHIVSYKGYDITCENDKLMYNVKMEYVAGGTLGDVVRAKGGKLDEAMIKGYTYQILQGLQYLHSSGIAHCDIKGANILIGESGAKLSDLGCAKWVNLAATATIGGTPMFMAPEVARGEEQGFPADIWALGCIIIEMATGGFPWPNISDPMSILYKIAYSGKSPDFPEFLSQQAVDFLSKCFKRNSNERWTVKQLLKHPFLEDYSLGRKQNQEFNTCSPTSILDQGVWNAIEEESEFFVRTRSLNSCPDHRIGCLSIDSRVAQWTWEETWITIRENNDGNEDKSLWVNNSYGW
ncbi:Protein kinase domain-containing protein [Heracleum sosnowskyi]|uniref:Protein kinase domain-containing protein n=1 Tax=Heracleum sosnowskyi TaxID=360622 RepID=A0AAD8IQF9_9APIA|nr:Protein kinase domain-containing protein [Heracleum sosnowskyi]